MHATALDVDNSVMIVDANSEHRVLLFIFGADVSLSPLSSPRRRSSPFVVSEVSNIDDSTNTSNMNSSDRHGLFDKYWTECESMRDIDTNVPRLLTFSAIDAYVLERLCEPEGFGELARAYDRALVAVHKLSDLSVDCIARKCAEIILKYAVLISVQPHLIPSSTVGTLQVAMWLCSVNLNDKLLSSEDSSICGRAVGTRSFDLGASSDFDADPDEAMADEEDQENDSISKIMSDSSDADRRFITTNRNVESSAFSSPTSIVRSRRRRRSFSDSCMSSATRKPRSLMSSSPFLTAWSNMLSSEALPNVLRNLMRSLVSLAGEQRLSSPDFTIAYRGILRLVHVSSRFATELVLLSLFMPSWMHGARFEYESWLGSLLRLGSAQEDFASIFTHPSSMSEQQRQLAIVQMRHKLDGAHELLIRIFSGLLSLHPSSGSRVARAGLLAWVGSTLMGNWERTRMRVQWRTASSDEFLLNLAKVMLGIGAMLIDYNSVSSISRIKLDFFSKRHRLVLGDETRLHASSSEVSDRMRALPEPNHSNEEQLVQRRSLGNVHCGIICDQCRKRNIHGIRFKCLQCRDYDVCETCEEHLYEQALGLRSSSAVLFSCPFLDCSLRHGATLSEVSLRAHVSSVHGSDQQQVSCPVCAVNGAAARYRRLHEHLQRAHPDTHDPITHVMLRVQHMMPSNHFKLFKPMPNIPLQVAYFNEDQYASSSASKLSAVVVVDDDDDDDDDANMVLDGLPLPLPQIHARSRRVQSRVVHPGTTCKSCHMSPIRGILYTCYNCHDLSLCLACRDSSAHQVSHLMIQIRRPLVIPNVDMDANDVVDTIAPTIPHTQTHAASRARPILYPSALVGSYDFELDTEWHFLTYHCLHVGFIQSCSRYSNLAASIDGERRNSRRDTLTRMRLAMSVQLLPAQFLSAVLALYGSTARSIIHAFDPNGIGLPLPLQCPQSIAVLPEYLLDDMAATVIFLARFSCSTFEAALPEPTQMDELKQKQQLNLTDKHIASCDDENFAKFHSLWIVRLFVYMISSPEYTKNPYLRSKLAEALSAVAPLTTVHGPGCTRMGLLLCADHFLTQNLLPSIIRLYVSVEHTGVASQFYDKFNVRNVLSVLFNFLLTHAEHRCTLSLFCKDAPEVLLQLVHCLFSDAIYVLDEVMSKASTAAKLLSQLQGPNSASSSPQHNQDIQRELASTKRNLRIVSTLSTEALRMITTLAMHEKSQDVLLRPEMVERVAHSINFYVVSLVDAHHVFDGETPFLDKAKDELSKCGFDVASLLRSLFALNVRLSTSVDFMQAIVRDGRCFKPDKFAAAIIIMNATASHNIAVETASKFVEDAKLLFKRDQSKLQDLGDIPDEFLDPILHTLMEDPVVLPTSGISIDRSVICRHLLSDQTDPFNRSKLTTDMLRSNVKLKQRIDDFLKRRRRSTPTTP